MKRIVLCAKWGNVFPPNYVNGLYRAVGENLTGDFRFVCLTNEAEGLAEGIECFPLPDLSLAPERYAKGAWPKLGVFQRDLYGLEGRALFIDLDSVITSDLSQLFEGTPTLKAIGAGDDWRRNKIPKVPELATGVFAFEIGKHSNILDSFMADKENAFARFANEQQFVEAHVSSWESWPQDWIVSFKRHLCHPIGTDLLRYPDEPSASTKIVAFHGKPRPIDLVNKKGIWMNFPHSIRCPVKWLDAYWERFAGSI